MMRVVLPRGKQKKGDASFDARKRGDTTNEINQENGENPDNVWRKGFYTYFLYTDTELPHKVPTCKRPKKLRNLYYEITKLL